MFFQGLCLEREISVLFRDFLRQEGPVAKEDGGIPGGNTAGLVSLLQDLPESFHFLLYLVEMEHL